MTPQTFLKAFNIRYKDASRFTAMVRVNNEKYYFYESLTVIKTPVDLVYYVDNDFRKKIYPNLNTFLYLLLSDT